MATIELNGAPESTVGPIRESLRAAEKARALRFPAGEDAPGNPELPVLASRIGKLLGFDENGDPEAIDPGGLGGGGEPTEIGDIEGLSDALDSKADASATTAALAGKADAAATTAALADKADAAATTAALAGKAPLASPAFTDTPTAPTAAPGTDTEQLATTAFVKAAVEAGGGEVPEIASQVEAEAGEDNTKIMTPLRVKQATASRVAAVSEFGSYITWDISAGRMAVLTLTGDRRVTFLNPPPGPFTLVVTQDETGGHELTFESDALITGAPSMDAGAVDLYRFENLDGQLVCEITNGFEPVAALFRELYIWGDNYGYETGAGINTGTIDGPEPALLVDWDMVSAASAHGLGIRRGKLYSWGSNEHGKTGQGTESGHTVKPTQIEGFEDWEFCACGVHHSFAIRDGGKLYAWGNDGSGRASLGLGTGGVTVPTQITAFNDWQMVSGGSGHSLAIREGMLYSCGSNANGRTGHGTASGSTLTFTQVGAETDWEFVECGTSHSMAIRGGKLFAFGLNTNGRTALGTSTGDTLAPTQVGAAEDWVRVGCGTSHGMGIRDGVGLFSWGANANGRTGQGTDTGETLTPTQVGVETDWSRVSCSMSTSTGQTLAIRDGMLYSCGANTAFQTGQGTSSGNTLTLTQVGVETDWVECVAVYDWSLAIRRNSGPFLELPFLSLRVIFDSSASGTFDGHFVETDLVFTRTDSPSAELLAFNADLLDEFHVYEAEVTWSGDPPAGVGALYLLVPRLDGSSIQFAFDGDGFIGGFGGWSHDRAPIPNGNPDPRGLHNSENGANNDTITIRLPE